ncbi:MAG TPA: type II secretion system minor pseudopilin GspK [Steroidobacteraceae bacterium]|nr:type II secretion system minor pseudopilin GspK [Steroidobacteraceae bacterium]
MNTALPARAVERGVALLTAIILVALAAIVATAIVWQSTLSARRAIAVFTVAQSLALAQGAEGMAGYALRDNRQKNPQMVATNQTWAMPYGPIEIDHGAELEAVLEDETGKFNLNSVVMAAAGTGVPGAPGTGAPGAAPTGVPGSTGTGALPAAAGGALVRNPTGVAQFEALLQALNLDVSFAARLVDWIDSDDQPIFPGGGEDSFYLAQEPAHRVPNLPLTSISELLAMGMDRASYDRLAPFVTALPPATKLNICTAPGEVLDAIAGQRSYTLDLKQLALQRQQNPCFPDMAGFMSGLGAAQKAGLNVGTTSSYFRLRTWITIGTTRFTLYSLLEQDPSGQTRPILRTFGTE